MADGHLRPQARWLVRKMARQAGLSEAETEQSILELIERGHLKIVEGEGLNGTDIFVPIIKSAGGNQPGLVIKPTADDIAQWARDG